VACLLLTAACGARLDDDQRALAIRGGGTGAGTGAASSSETEAGDAATDGGSGAADISNPGGIASDPGAGAAAPDAAGDEAVAADPGAAPTAGGGACTSSGKPSDVGVTANEITIGNVSTISGPIPDFGRTGVNGVKAYVNYVNSRGGICGRKVRLITADDRLDAGANKSETDKLKDKVFALVGGTTVVDDGGAASLKGTNVPDLALAIAPARVELANNFSPNPIDPTIPSQGLTKIFQYWKDTYGVSNGAVIWAAQAAARSNGKKFVKDMEMVGIKITPDHQFEVGVTETNYSAQAAKIKNDKVDIVITALEVNGMSKLAQAFGQARYFPKVPYYGAQAYGRKFLQLAGRNAEGTKIALNFNTLEVADQVPAVKNFLTWYERTNPGADIDFFAIQAWLAADMWGRATKAAGPDPTRDKVLDVLRTYTSYEADGFLGKINPAQKKPAQCFIITEVQGGAWKKTYPAGPGFAC
jgi:ABC-type branched-subunit amino acid transport system substrate-binding protein